MSDRNKLDDFFKKKLGERQPVFDANTWSQMESLLEEKPKKERKWIFLWFFLGIAVLALVIWGVQRDDVPKNINNINYANKEVDREKIIESSISNQNNKEEMDREFLNKKTISSLEESKQTEPVKQTGTVNVLKEGHSVRTYDFVPKRHIPHIPQPNLKENNTDKEGALEAIKEEKSKVNAPAKTKMKLPIIALLERGGVKAISNNRHLVIEDQSRGVEKVEKKKRPLSYALYAGTKNFIRETTNGNELGLGWEAGLELTQPIGQHWGLGLGLSFYQRNKFLNTSSEVLLTSSETTIQTTASDTTLITYPADNARLTYLKIPVFVAYQKGASIFQLGVWGSYIIDAKGDLEQFTLINNANVGGFEDSTIREPLSLSDLRLYRRFDYGLDLKYAYRISNHWEASAGLSYGFTTVLNNDGTDILESSDTSGSSSFPDTSFSIGSVSSSIIRERQVYFDIGLRYRF